MKTRENVDIILEIAARAEDLGLLESDMDSLIMDLECADMEFDLKLDELLIAEDFLFALDIVGIQRNVDRENERMKDGFVPIFVGR